MNLYSFSHFLQPWLLPPGCNILLIFLGIIIRNQWRLLGKILTLAGLLSLWLFSTPYVAYNLINILQNKYSLLSPGQIDEVQSRDVIVVLGGGDTIDAEYNFRHTVSDVTLHRLNYAAYLSSKTHLPIIVSGGKSIGAIDSEADLMTNYLQETYQITPLLKEDKSLNTADESRLMANILQNNKFATVYLVTNAWHMPRSVFIFECWGIRVKPAPMGYFIYGPGYGLISFLPNIDALKTTSIAMREWIGLVWYHLSYSHICSQHN
jgi:uncharacterized SAM-binding protein YcdF (DUF218 family)